VVVGDSNEKFGTLITAANDAAFNAMAAEMAAMRRNILGWLGKLLIETDTTGLR
jgi:hypothetical protein